MISSCQSAYTLHRPKLPCNTPLWPPNISHQGTIANQPQFRAEMAGITRNFTHTYHHPSHGTSIPSPHRANAAESGITHEPPAKWAFCGDCPQLLLRQWASPCGRTALSSGRREQYSSPGTSRGWSLVPRTGMKRTSHP